ncbi:hypothetical protein [Symbiobacterium terraclitae]|uniref:hypothetical protein n=1 Tax=Symbiobacterium terraclitae TaxID=557451 RepID=UPI0035B519A5
MQTLSQRLAQAMERLEDEELAGLLAEVQQVLEEIESEDPIGRAISTLSVSEEAVLKSLLESVPNERTVQVVTSQIADQTGISRSSVVSVLRRLQSAGLLETRSLGTKGTHIVFRRGIRPYDILKRLKPVHV